MIMLEDDVLSRKPRRVQLILLIAVVAFVSVIRLPSIWYRKGGQDEQWYTVPGWTVAREGIPRIPYSPVDDSPASVFQGSHRLLHALPPAYFYAQAPFFWIFPPGYGTARLASWGAGISTLLLLFALMREFGVRQSIALTSLVICGFGRAFFFPWQDSRPDMLCAMFGVASILCVVRARLRDQRKLVVFSGISVGLGALSHPYALMFAFQVGLILLLSDKPIWQRLLECVLAGTATLAAMTLWLPLILLNPDSFVSQFTRNVLSRSGPGIVSRMLWPWPYVPFQANLVFERLGTLQTVVFVATVLTGLWMFIASVFGKRQIETIEKPSLSALPVAALLACSSMYLHVASVGSHMAKGYLCYPWAMIVLLLAVIIERLLCCFGEQSSRKVNVIIAVLLAGVLLMFVPGSGLRANWTYATRCDEVNYNRQAFSRMLNERFPPDARLLVTPEFVFEFEVLGRRPVNASLTERYQNVEGLPFEFLIVSTQTLDEEIAESLACELLWKEGDPDDPLACYVEVYQPGAATPQGRTWPR